MSNYKLKKTFTTMKRIAIILTIMLAALSVSAQEEELYAVIDTGTVVIYYGKDTLSNAYHLESYVFDKYEVRRVIFDTSVKNYYPKSCKGWFKCCEFLKEISGLEYLNTDSVTDMSEMFMGCEYLETLDLSVFKTSNVTDMSNMFSYCESLKTIFTTDDFDTSALKRCDSIFYNCYNLCGSKGTRGYYHRRMSNKSYLRIDGGEDAPGYFTLKGQEPYTEKKEEKVVYRRKLPTTKEFAVLKDSTLILYYGGEKPSDSTIYTIGDYGDDCEKIAYVVFDKSFKNFYPKTCAHWFRGLKNLKEIRGMKEYLNTQNVVYMDYMFCGCKSLETIDLSNFKTSRTKYMGALLCGCEKLKSVNLSSFTTANVYDMSMMFEDCKKLDTLDLSSFNTQKVKYMNFMFYNCDELKTIYVSDKWTTKNALECNFVYGCKKLVGGNGNRYGYGLGYARIDGNGGPGLLTRAYHPYPQKEYAILKGSILYLYYGKEKPKDTKIYTIGDYGCDNNKIEYVIIDESLKKFKPFYCQGWFENCTNLKDITGLEYLNTENVIDMSDMFRGCKKMETLDLSHFNMSKVVNMDYMFYGCDNLKTIYVSDKWTTKSVASSRQMFSYCKNLIGGNDTECPGYYYGGEHQFAHIDRGESNPGYLTKSGQKSCDPKYADKDTVYTTFDEGVLTFYYGKPRLIDIREIEKKYVKKIVFDSSFKNYYPKNCNRLFYEYTQMTEIIDIEKYFNTDSVTDMSEMFAKCYRLEKINLQHFNTNNVTNMHGMFYNCCDLTKLDVSSFATQNVTNMSMIFDGCSNIQELDLSNFNTEKVEKMDNMFRNCYNLKHIDLNSFNTTNVSNMNSMFYCCKQINELDLSKFNTANVVNTGDMFSHCNKLKTIYVSERWNLDNVKNENDTIYDGYYWGTEIGYNNESGNGANIMFYNCPSLVGGNGTKFHALNIGKDFAKIDGGQISPGYFTIKGQKMQKSKKTAYVVLKNNVLTFYYGRKPNDAFDINGFNTPEWANYAAEIYKVVFDKSFKNYYPTSCYEWFSGCCNLTEIVGMKENLHTDNVRKMTAMFMFCIKLQNIDLSGFNTKNVLDMISMFDCCMSLEHLDLSCFNTQNVRTMAFMFENCENIKELDLSNFNTENVSNMNSMFYNCKSLEKLNLKSFNTTKTIGLEHLFGNCISLTNIDLSNFDLSDIDDGYRHFNFMFENCTGLKTLDLSNLTNVYGDFTGMFFGCENLEKIKLFQPIKNFDEYPLSFNMPTMFYGCKSLTTLDLSDFNIKECPSNVAYMFAECENLATIYVSENWNVKYIYRTEVESWDGYYYERIETHNHNFANMFKNCPKLTGGKGSKWSSDNVSNENFCRIDGGAGNPGYFTRKEVDD